MVVKLRWLFFVAMLLLVVVVFYSSDKVVLAQIADPIPDPIVKSGLAVQIEDFVQVTPSSGSPPLARINLLYHSRDNTGRLFVNDMRGKLYVINSDIITTYLDFLDLATFHSNFVDTPGLGIGFISFVFHPDFSTNGKFYTAHSETPGSVPPDMVSSSPEPTVVHNVIKEWTADDPSANVFTGTSREILRTAQPAFSHAIQEIGFNPNANPGDTDYGMLYIAHGFGDNNNPPLLRYCPEFEFSSWFPITY